MIREISLWGKLEAIMLDNEDVEVILLPQKGSDLIRFRDKKQGLDYLHVFQDEIDRYMHDEQQNTLAPLGDYFFGGCYTMFPNAGVDQTFEHRHYDYHGDLRKAAWDYEIEDRALKLRASSRYVPLGIERTVTLAETGTRLQFTDRLFYDNNQQAAGPIPYIYGIHPYHSYPLLDENTRCIVDGKTVAVLPERQHDKKSLDFYKVEREGTIEVWNPRLPRSIRITFDKNFMNYVWVWFDLNKTGSPYVNALIPCTANGHDGIAGAVQNHSIRFMNPGEQLITQWSMELIAPSISAI